MYNIFRLTGRYAEAAYLRELFDEPTTVLYQVAALIRTIDEADRPGAEFDAETLVAQADTLIMSAVAALEGKAEADMVRHLLRVRDTLARTGASAERNEDVEGIKAGALEAVNEYFKRRLMDVPGIASYIADLHAATNGARGVESTAGDRRTRPCRQTMSPERHPDHVAAAVVHGREVDAEQVAVRQADHGRRAAPERIGRVETAGCTATWRPGRACGAPSRPARPAA